MSEEKTFDELKRPSGCDLQGDKYLRRDELAAGMNVRLDAGYTCRINEVVKVRQDSQTGQFYFSCSHGRHFFDTEREYLTGVYPCVR